MSAQMGPRFVRALLASAPVFTALPAFAACAGLSAAAHFSAGASVRAITSADFNRDGIADLAVANGSGASLSVLLGLGANGTGNGSFASPVAYAAGSVGTAVATGDFNSDGATDLVVGVSNGVAVWLGNGAGAFSGGAITLAGSSVRGIACGDFDRDGIEDLALASSSTNAVLFLRGLGSNGAGNGTFATPVATAVGTAPARLVAFDLDRDGNLDVACANNTSANVSLLRGDGHGAFASAVNVAAPGSPWGLAVLDADADGRPDLLVSNGAGSAVTLLRNTGAFALAAAGSFTTATAPRDLAVADFDGDGLADVAAACAGPSQVSVLHGDGHGVFTLLGSYASGAGATSIVAADFDGNRSADLATGNQTAGTASRLLATCPAAAGAQVTLLAPNGGDAWWPGHDQVVRWTRGAGVIAVDVDLSRDGGASWTPLARSLTGSEVKVPGTGATSENMRVRVRDAVVAARSDASDAAFSLCGLFRAPLASDAGIAATQLARADLDGDGIDDLIAAGGMQAAVLRGLGSGGAGNGRFSALAPFTTGDTRRVRVADVDADGLADLLLLGATAIEWRTGDGALGFSPARLVPAAGGVDFVTGDFDEDGATDLAMLTEAGGAARLVVRTSAGAPFASEWSAPLDGSPRQILAADLDGDGITDLALALGTRVEIWPGRGSAGRGDGTFAFASGRALPATAGELAVADFDRDGRLDLLACSPASGDVWTLPVQSLSGDALVLGTPTGSSAGAAPFSPVPGDFDGDGQTDLALADSQTGQVHVLTGSGTAFSSPLALGAGAGAIVPGDFLRDGQADLVVADPEHHAVVCLAAQCPPIERAEIALQRRPGAAGVVTSFEQRISWTRTAAVALVRVELSRDDGAHWSTLVEASADSAYTWTVTGPPCERARLRVSDASASTRADVSAPFAIRAPFGNAITSPAAQDAPGIAFALTDPGTGGASDALVVTLTQLSLAHGAIDGSFGTPAALGAATVRDLVLADVDSDGRADAVALGANAIQVWRALPSGGYAEPLTLPTMGGNVAIAAADFDEDGRIDLAVACGAAPAQRVALWRGTGPGADGVPAFAPLPSASLPGTPLAMSAADVNADGILDLVVAHAAGLVTLLGNGAAGHGNGSFRLGASRAFPASVRALLTADLDGDGRLDVAAADGAGALLVCAGSGTGAFASPANVPLGAPGRALACGDLDGDGMADFAVALETSGVALVRGSGRIAAGAFASAGVLEPAAAIAALALRDVTGDGVPDLVTLEIGTGALRVRAGARTAAARPRLVSAAPAFARAGDEVDVRWSGALLAADVQLSRDGGAHWSTLAGRVSGGAWRWTVSEPVTGLARLRVRDSAAPLLADTSASFRLEPVMLDAGGALRSALAFGAPRPNPSSGAIAFELELPGEQHVRVDVCDVSGRRVRTLENGVLGAGRHLLRWDGRDDSGIPLPPGSYFARARTRGLDSARTVTRTR